MFPFEDADYTRVTDTAPAVPKEYGIDFATGQLTGKVVTGLEAVKVWIWMALQTPRYRYFIYSWDYGHELETLIGKGYTRAYIESAIEAMIEDALSVNPYIEGITECSITFSGSHVTADVTVATNFGEVNLDVRDDNVRVHNG